MYFFDFLGNKKSSRLRGFFIMLHAIKNYFLEVFLVATFFLATVDFVLDFFVQQAEEEHFLLNCSTAIDQKYSSLP